MLHFVIKVLCSWAMRLSIFAALLRVCAALPAQARCLPAQAPPAALLPLNEPEGVALLARTLSPAAACLMSHYVTQQTPGHCGAASAVMVLNCLSTSAPKHPASPRYTYFSQNNLFSPAVTSLRNAAEVRALGMSMAQLQQVLACWGVRAERLEATAFTAETFLATLAEALAAGDYLILNFSRTALGQLGSGHHSPLAAYDGATDRYLVLDVARYKQPPFWVQAVDLWRAVATRDAFGNPRGALRIRLRGGAAGAELPLR